MNTFIRSAALGALLAAGAMSQAVAAATVIDSDSIAAFTPDSFSFNLASDSFASFTATVRNGSNVPVKPLSFDLYSGTTLIAASSSLGSISTNNTYSNLLAGMYTLKFESSVAGTYKITQGTGVAVTAVPEPESIALALAGIGVAGTLLRRRKLA